MTSKNRLVNFPIYTIGDLSSGIYGIGPAILLMFYMTNVLGIPIAIATVAASLPKLMDLLFSPFIGSWSDRTSTRLGRRRPYLLASAILIFPLFLGIWAAPFKDPMLSACFIAVTYTACSFCYAAFLVPYCALNSEITTTYNDNSVLNSYRASYSMMGCLLAGAGAPMIVEHFGGSRTGYAAMGISLAGIMCVSMLITFFASKEPRRTSASEKISLRDTLRAIVGNRPFACLTSTYILHMIAGGIVSASLAYFVTYVLGKDVSTVASIFFLSFGVSIATIPIFLAVGKKVGKHATFTSAYVIAVFASLGFASLDHQSSMLHIYAVGAFAGLAEGAIQAFGYAMLSDCIRHGDSRQGALLSGVFIAGEKIALAIGAVLAGSVLTISGLLETEDGSIAQPDSAITGIRIAIVILPIALNVLGALLFINYRKFDTRIAQQDMEDQLMKTMLTATTSEPALANSKL